ncbi:MAG TPA: hypothetical protein VK465_09540 [Fibrobacteria bacterium]|nr:hypothetical protein [Fibrobacteria bacterium]
MASETVRQLEQAYDSGDLDGMKASILPFIRKNRDKLIEFIQGFQRIEGPCPLDRLVKFFIIQNNMPFDMAQYMAKQSSAIRKDINEVKQDMQERQANVAEWIRQKAEAHRSTSMFEQVFCFEKLKDQLLPLIEEELGLHAEPAGIHSSSRPDEPLLPRG